MHYFVWQIFEIFCFVFYFLPNIKLQYTRHIETPHLNVYGSLHQLVQEPLNRTESIQLVSVKCITLQDLIFLYVRNSPESQHLVPEISQSGRSVQSFPPLTVVSPHLPVNGYNSTQVFEFVFLAALAALYLPLVNITLLILQYDPPHLAI